MSEAIVVERALTPARMAELGVEAWPRWKEAVGTRDVPLNDAEKSYFLAGEAVLTLAGGEPVVVTRGDLVIIPAGTCRWEVSVEVRRHYRSDALSPACCIV